jgi:DNA-directed RNA polymerase subunit H (RpoH/RPB5)
MKSIKNQYIALKEGKMSEAQFMRNVRMTLPEYISNVTLFKQAERILINKGIISEIKVNEETSDEKIGRFEKYKYTLDGKSVKPDEIAFYNNILKAEIDGKIYKIGIPQNGVVELNPTTGKTGIYTESEKSLNESKEGYYNQDGKEQYSKFNELDNMNAQEIMAGYVMEKQDNPNIDQKEAVKLVIKNLKKDQFYYTNYKLTGIRGLQPTEFTSTKRKSEFDEMEEVNKNGDNFVDDKNKMVVIKESQYTYKYKIGDSFTVKNLQKDPYPVYKNVKIGDVIKITKVWENLAGPVYGTNVSEKTGLDEEDIAELTSSSMNEAKIEDIKALLSDETLKNSQIGDSNEGVSIIYDDYKELPYKDLDKLRNSFKVDADRLSDIGETEVYQYYISDKMNEAMKPDSKLKLKELVRKMMKEMFDGRDNLTDVTGEND